MLSEADNQRLTRVGPGTPMGELLRRYWHPIAAALELDEDPIRPLRLLGEDLALYRDKGGHVGLVDRHCPHRGADMNFAIRESHGLRCSYHGWTFDADGRCLEQPFEGVVRPDSGFKDRVRMRAYPVAVKAGLVWAYLGPLPAPCLPDWARFHDPGRPSITITTLPCNWLQCQENSIDPLHVEWLHQNLPLDRFGDGTRGARHLKLAFDEFEHGFIYRRVLDNTDESHPLWTVGRVSLWPNCLFIGSFIWHVPIDDEQTLDVSWHLDPNGAAPPGAAVPYCRGGLDREPDGRISAKDGRHQDAIAMIGQGAIADRTREHVGDGDRGILLLRSRLLSELDAVAHGKDPKGILRDPSRNHRLPLPLTGFHDEQPFVRRRSRRSRRRRARELMRKALARVREAAGWSGTDPAEKTRRRRRRRGRPGGEPDLAALVESYRLSALLFVAADLGVADALADGPRTSADLGQALGAHSPSLDRILKALVAHGVFAHQRDLFANNEASGRLLRDAPGSLHGRALLAGREFMPAWLGLAHTARTGATAFGHVFGMTNWQHREAHPALDEAFNRFMASGARRSARSALEVYDFGRHAHVADIGGGTGLFLGEILAAHSGLRGTLVDQAHVLDAARENLGRLGVAARCAVVPGDLFEPAPPGADAYILKSVLHDWDDESAAAIVRGCASAMSVDARLLVIEAILPEDEVGDAGTRLLDIHMLAVDGGRERRLSDYENLLASAGLRLKRRLPLGSTASLLEAGR
jgi:5,5'-dehydrodivanillate O-demethylase